MLMQCFKAGDRVMTPTHTKQRPHTPMMRGTVMNRDWGTLRGDKIRTIHAPVRDRLGRYMVRLDGDGGVVFAHESELVGAYALVAPKD